MNIPEDKLEQEECEEAGKTSMKIICKKHNSQAEYFSKETGEYICSKCLVESQGLNPIDEQTKKYMLDFDESR